MQIRKATMNDLPDILAIYAYAREYMKEHGIDEIIVHAPYIINLGNSVKPETFELAVEFLAKEIERTAACKSHTLVLHPGSHVGAGTDAGIRQIIKGLNSVLTADTPLSYRIGNHGRKRFRNRPHI